MSSRYCNMNLNRKSRERFAIPAAQGDAEPPVREDDTTSKGRQPSLGFFLKDGEGRRLPCSVPSHPNLRIYWKPKLCNKERVRLKDFCSEVILPSSLLFPKQSFRGASFVLVFMFLFFSPLPFSSSASTEESNLQWCPSQCTCETFFLPTVSGVQNAWPSLLTSSLLSEALLVPLRNPTSFEALIASILSTQSSSEEESSRDAEGKNGTHYDIGFQGDMFSSSAPRTGSLISPGEVFVDCSNGALQNTTFFEFSQQPEELQKIVKLDLSSNDLTSLQRSDFQKLTSLRYLILDTNFLDVLSATVLPPTLLHLSLERNRFLNLPDNLNSVRQLKILNLAKNQLTSLKKNDLPLLSSLVLLSLHGNTIHYMDKRSLAKLPRLEILDLTDNSLTAIPEAITKCQSLRQILLGDNKITYVPEGSFTGLKNLQWVDLQGNPLTNVHPYSFVGLTSLVKLILESVRNLDQIPSFNGTANLKALRIDRGGLTSVPENLCTSLPKIKSLNFHLNKIQSLPDLTDCKGLRLLDLSNNKIQSLGHKHFEGVPSLHDLLLQYNFIDHIPDDAFVGLRSLQVLNLEYNRIAVIHSEAFLPLISLEDINLGNNNFPELPSVGLEKVVNLKAHNNRYLRVFPGPESFPAVHSLMLSYAYHCCPFLSYPYNSDLETSTEFQEDVVFSVDQLHKFGPDIWNNSNVWPHIEGIPTSEFINVWAKREDSDPSEVSSSPYEVTSPVTPSLDILLGKGRDGNSSILRQENRSEELGRRPTHNIYCIPQPGPFMPCRDLFDWWTLRCGVWLVFLLALMGNGVVVIVLVSAYSKMDVPRFLVSNLALADFFMGIYLGILAVVDASTLGDFRMYAIPWQMSAGCQLAGFLGVLSSELSVYTLTVITMERNYAITHAMHLNKRLSLKHAAYIMAVGWMFALTMAILPLTGISDYRKFAVCLPFETDGAGLGYIVFLMFINGIAFLILMGCYLKIYCAIRGSQAWNSNDSRIAKRMALLVFTDFICWAPIAFFSLSAAFGMQLISLEGAKVFTVFVLPFNSCCNPFLYALLTKQFKKDCVMLCKAIEESRVTRGIGRCRHSSNFSNRQTPANTNSALDPNSKEEHQTCNCRLKEKKNLKGNVIMRSMRYLCCYANSISKSAPGKSTTHVNRSPSKEIRASTTENPKALPSWPWRGQTASNLRLLELRRQTTMDLARKSSQESSLSSSRNDSSGTSGSTVTWRISRSSVSSDASSSGAKGARNSSLKDKTKTEIDPASKPETGFVGRTGLQPHTKPRLQRQRAIDKEPGTFQPPYGNELRCPLHARGDNLSCVYEQASLEEEDSNEVFLVSEPQFHSHKRSLSDGLLCGTLLSLSAPTPQLISSIAPSLHKSTSSSKDQVPNVYTESSEVKTESYDEGISSSNDATTSSGKPGVLETHFPVVDRSHEGDPLLHKRD